MPAWATNLATSHCIKQDFNTTDSYYHLGWNILIEISISKPKVVGSNFFFNFYIYSRTVFEYKFEVYTQIKWLWAK